MRRISCDQYEFDLPDSEQFLELAIAAPSRHYRDLAAFLDACGASSCRGSSLPKSWFRWQLVVEQVRRFAGVELPHPSQCRETVLLNEEWNDVEVGVAVGSVLIWYHWFTTA